MITKDKIATALKQMFTESDNLTHDLHRYLAAAAVLVGLFLSVFVVVKQGKDFDMETFGIGVGMLLAGLGAALGLKPESKNTNRP